MSDDHLPPDSEQDKKSLRIVKDGDQAPRARPSQDSIHQLYMASVHVEWTPFAESHGWNPSATRKGLPIDEWIKEKKNVLALEQAERIADTVFKARGRWHTRVLKTLDEFPESNEMMHKILRNRMNDIIGMLNEDNQEKQKARVLGTKPDLKFPKIKTNELLGLAAALKVTQESMHKSLLLDVWSFQLAEKDSDVDQFRMDKQEAKTEWRIELRGMENVTGRQLQEQVAKWYDQPPPLHSPDEIENSANREDGDDA